ncbi:MAG: lipopolysaccharide biosynthesis protein [Cyanobacteria bacterium P01_G01_bin.19]
MLISRLKKKFSSQFIRGMGWLGVAQIFVRVFRLGTTVVLARVFTPYDYGLVAIIYTIFGFAQVFTESNGISANVITTDEENLEQISNTTYWISWIVCIFIAILQCALALPIAWFYDDRHLVLPICALGLMYLTFPLYKITMSLIQRENRMKIVALGRATQAFVLNITIICLALLGLGVWSVVIGMILSASALIIVYYKNHSWRPPKKFKIDKWREVTSLGGNMLGIDLMDKIRLNFDYLIVGRFLGVDALGLYFFAFNAGLGISKQIINAMTMSLLPYLSSANTDLSQIKSRFYGSLKSMILIFVPLVLLQSGLAPFYVPIIFGAKWTTAIPILIIICLSAIPLMIYTACYQLLVATRKMRAALVWNLVFTLVFATSILVVVQYGILWVAITVLTCHILNVILGFCILKYRQNWLV